MQTWIWPCATARVGDPNCLSANLTTAFEGARNLSRHRSRHILPHIERFAYRPCATQQERDKENRVRQRSIPNKTTVQRKNSPRLADLCMIGQWVEPGGELRPVALSGRDVAQTICRGIGNLSQPARRMLSCERPVQRRLSGEASRGILSAGDRKHSA